MLLLVLVISRLMLSLSFSLPSASCSSIPTSDGERNLLTALPSMRRSMRQTPHLQPSGSRFFPSMRLCLDCLINRLHPIRLCPSIFIFFISLIRLRRISLPAFSTFLFRGRGGVLIIPISRVFRLLETFSSLQIPRISEPRGFTKSGILSTGCTRDGLKRMERGVPLMGLCLWLLLPLTMTLNMTMTMSVSASRYTSDRFSTSLPAHDIHIPPYLRDIIPHILIRCHSFYHGHVPWWWGRTFRCLPCHSHPCCVRLMLGVSRMGRSGILYRDGRWLQRMDQLLHERR